VHPLVEKKKKGRGGTEVSPRELAYGEKKKEGGKRRRIKELKEFIGHILSAHATEKEGEKQNVENLFKKGTTSVISCDGGARRFKKSRLSRKNQRSRQRFLI